MVCLGLTARLMSIISSNRSFSCLCRPDVSTMITSKRFFLKDATPADAIATGSVSVYEP